MKPVKILLYVIAGIFLCLSVAIYLLKPNLTSEELYFFKNLQKNHKQNQFEVPIKQLTQFEWHEAIWLGSYGGFDPNIQIGEKIHSLDKYNLDLQNDGAWALIFINNNQITTVIQGKLFKLLGPYRYLSFSRKNPPNKKRYYPSDIIKLNEKFEFMIIRGSK